MRLVVAGYYGCGNIGDDALLLGLLRGLNGAHDITVLSGDPAATSQAFGVDAVPRKDIKRATDAIRNAEALVFGGGGLLQDTTSILSLKYYTHLIETACHSGKRVALLGQGIGPIRSVLGRRAAGRAFAKCDVITTRDEGSMRLVDRLAPDGKAKKAVTDDLAWLAVESKPDTEPRRAIAISARPWKSATARIVEAFSTLCEKAKNDGWEVVPVSFDRGMDDSVLSQILPGGTYVDSPQQMFAVLGGAGATVGMRLHAGIFSAALGVVPTMVSYDDKVTAFAESLGTRAILLDKLNGPTLWAAFEKSLADAARLQESVRRRAEIGARRARINITMLEEMLQGVRTS